MPVKVVPDAVRPKFSLRKGDYFFAGGTPGHEAQLYCYVVNTKCTKAQVINGAYGIIVDPETCVVTCAYNPGVELEIRYVGQPGIPEPGNYNEALGWFEDEVKAGRITT